MAGKTQDATWAGAPFLGREMLERLLYNLPISTSPVQERSNGAAFLRLAKQLYPVESVTYIAFNIPIADPPRAFLHCSYSDSWAKQCTSAQRVSLTDFSIDAILDEGIEWGQPQLTSSCGHRVPNGHMLGIRIPHLCGEAATMIVTADAAAQSASDFHRTIGSDFGALASHFHRQVTKLFGVESADEIAVTSRELDCLKWIAMGKTAWEASVILGISERTVRFHLNSAREKLCCMNTTQAVARAVAKQLIFV